MSDVEVVAEKVGQKEFLLGDNQVELMATELAASTGDEVVASLVVVMADVEVAVWVET